MGRVSLIVWTWVCFVLSTMATEHFIVLNYGDNDSLIQEKLKYESVLAKHSSSNIDMDIKKIGTTSVLRLGPFVRNDNLALNYIRLKEIFPNAVIVEEKKSLPISKPIISTVEKKVYVTKEVPVEIVDDSLWIALFGLAIVGVLFMFLSSDQIKRLKKEHEKIKFKHKKLEEKQHEVLSSMGENIHTLAKETMGHTSMLAEKVKETPLENDVQKVMYNENELLDVTGDLIRFLRLKSKKVIIQNEVFNFNHVLNEVAGMLNNAYRHSDVEVIFDIDKEVPRFMLADSLHLGQILTNLLEYVVQNAQTKEVNLEVVTLSSLKEGLQLRFSIESTIVVDNKETLFDSYYDEDTRRYVGLGLFVAKELTHLMNGELLVLDGEDGYNSLVLTIPIEEKNKEKRKYRLPDKGLVGKKILIVDRNLKAANATAKLFTYFRAEVTLLTAEKFGENIPNFVLYDIVALNDNLFNFKIFEALKVVKKSQGLKVISLNNLFSSEESILNDVIDISLKKPLTQEYVFDTLVELYEEKNLEESVVDSVEKEKLLVYRDTFKDVQNVTLESFHKFEGAHILIVEDNVINQKVVQSVLSKSHMILTVANNGKEAVEFMRTTKENVDFIFMDINMPVMDGYRATELIRNDNRFDDVVIVALTALVSEHEIEKMFDSGMNGYLPKPVRIEKLYSALEMFVKSKKKEEIPVSSSVKKEMMLLEGINIEVGLSHMKENDIFYREVLQEFMDAYDNSDTLFEKLVKEKRFTQIKMLCLDMKGLTGTIGAKEMHNVINEIHQHLIYNKPELLHSYIARYKTEFSKLKNSIGIYLAS